MKQQIVINVYGGMVQDVYAEGEVDVTVVDWDAESCLPDEPGVVEVKTEDGRRRRATVAADYPTHRLDDLHPDIHAAMSVERQP